MARNLARSSSGTLSSSARSSRRAPKSRRDCSRLVNRWYPKASICWKVGGVGALDGVRRWRHERGIGSHGVTRHATWHHYDPESALTQSSHVVSPLRASGPSPSAAPNWACSSSRAPDHVALYVIAELGAKSKIPPHIGPFLGILLGLSLVAHMANRWLVPQANAVILPLAVLLNGIGYVVIARWNPPYAKAQAGWAALGVVLYVAHAAGRALLP